jgi:hypothetical protein
VTIVSSPAGTTTAAVAKSGSAAESRSTFPFGASWRDTMNRSSFGPNTACTAASSNLVNCFHLPSGERMNCANSPLSPFCTLQSTRPVGS